MIESKSVDINDSFHRDSSVMAAVPISVVCRFVLFGPGLACKIVGVWKWISENHSLSAVVKRD